jgi:FecR protein
MRLVRGSIEVLATKVLRAKPLEVQTPTAVIGVRGTEYRVHHDETPASANPTRTEVLEGRVRADLAPSATASAPLGADVAAGFGAALRAGQAPLVAPLLPAPDLAGVLPRYERPLVRLAVPPSPQPLRVQVAADAAFDRVVFDERLPAGATEARVAGLADGPWFVRVRRIDTAGIEGYDATRPFTLKARPEPPATLQPQARQKLAVGTVVLGWAENIEAARYRVQVARDPGFSQIVQQADGQTGAQAQVAVAEPGVYHWRLASVRADGDTGPWGDARQFEARPLPEPPTGGASADGKTLEISWSGREEDRHQVELARDGGFADVLHRADLKATHWALPMPAAGTYYFRYRSVEADGFVSPWSSTLKLEAPQDWRFLWLLAPWLLAL